jgi:hypothetical protein
MDLTIPVIQFFEYDTAEVASPVGTRNIPGGSFAFKQLLALGCQNSDPNNPGGTSGILTFDNLRINATNPVSETPSKVAAITVRTATSGTAISNMRLYLRDDSALRASIDRGRDPILIQMSASGEWLPNPLFPSGAGDPVTILIPTNPNVKRQDGTPALLANDDLNASQFIYLRMFIPVDTALGTFGVCGSGLLTFGFSFDYYFIP